MKNYQVVIKHVNRPLAAVAVLRAASGISIQSAKYLVETSLEFTQGKDTLQLVLTSSQLGDLLAASMSASHTGALSLVEIDSVVELTDRTVLDMRNL